MPCPADELLAAWSAGTAAAVERAAVEAHAGECASCRTAIAALFAPAAGRGDSTGDGGTGFGAVGVSVGRYRVLGPLGHGAMGVVLRARDPVLDREVALKMIHAATITDAQREQVLHEAQTMARLHHPNVVAVHDAGVVGDEVFLAMERISGPTLRVWLATRPSRAAVVAVLAGVGRGLQAVHEAGVVHRDIKLDNILIRDGAVGAARDGAVGVLADFGLARDRPAAGTAAGSGLAGTPAYLAPEVRGGAAASAASDQYAWWLAVIEALVGARGDAGLRGDALPAAVAALPRGWRAAARRGLADDPGQRFHSMSAAVAALERAAAGPRRRLAVAAAIVALAGGAALALGATRRPASDPCPTPDVGIWAAGARTAAEARVTAVDRESARVLAAVDARVGGYRAARPTACRASRSSDEAVRLAGLRELMCLDETWSETEALIAGLSDADDAMVVATVDNIAMLLPVERCAQGAPLALPPPPPPAVAAQVADLERGLRRLRMAARNGDPAAALPALRALTDEIAATGYAPLALLQQLDIASLQVLLGDLDAARQGLAEVAAQSERLGDDPARARALTTLLKLEYLAGHAETGLEVATRARPIVERLGNPGLEADLRIAEAALATGVGDNAAAQRHLLEAVALLDRASPDVTPTLAAALQNLGAADENLDDLAAAQVVLTRAVDVSARVHGTDSPSTWSARGALAANRLYSGDLAGALPLFEQVDAALTRLLGEAHPDVFQIRGHLCELRLHLARTTAGPACDAALAAAEAVYGPDSPQLLWPLSLIGELHVIVGQLEQALPVLERLATIARTGRLSPRESAGGHAWLALCLRLLDREPARARRLAEEARAVLVEIPSFTDTVRFLDQAFPP